MNVTIIALSLVISVTLMIAEHKLNMVIKNQVPCAEIEKYL